MTDYPYHHRAKPDAERCPSRHPDAKPWDDNDVGCWLVADHQGFDHRTLIPPPCRECGGLTMHSDICSQPTGDSRASWQTWNTEAVTVDVLGVSVTAYRIETAE